MSLPGEETQAATLSPLANETREGSPLVAASRWLVPGDTVSRYMIVRRVGVGGMGVVYAAYDPELDRRVALKLLRGDVLTNRGKALQRFVREAKAMARLSHPNVITVFDAGMVGEEAFLAMEFVEGHTLGTWLREEKRSWVEIAEVFARAGRGLGAAHDANIIHRDFKPDNVLIGAGGSVQVTDFGIARAAGPTASIADVEADADPEDGPHHESELDQSLTRTGAIVGTPAYMAPEQRLGLRSDARSDQFSFCVALHESLYGQHPFEGATPYEVSAAMHAGAIREPPPGSGVPARFRRLIRRGLNPDPSERYASMDQLLAELAPSRRAWGRAAGLVLAAAGAGALVAAIALGDDVDPCADSAELIAEVWGEPQREAVQAALTASGDNRGQDANGRVVRTLDARAAEWIGVRRSYCVATYVDHTSEEREFDARMACLEDWREDLRASVSLLSDLRPDEIDRHGTVLDTRSPKHCELAPTRRRTAQALSPAELQAKQSVMTDVYRANALLRMGRLDEAEAAARRAIETASAHAALDYPKQVGEAVLARVLLDKRDPDAERIAMAAFLSAVTRGDEGMIGTIVTTWMRTLEHDRSRFREAELVGLTALAAVRRSAPDGAIEGEIRIALGSLYTNFGKFEEARACLEYAAALVSGGPGNSVDRANVLLNLGAMHYAMGRYDEAIEATRESLALVRRERGERSPEVVRRLLNLANADAARDRLPEALAAAEEAFEIASSHGDAARVDMASAAAQVAAWRLRLGRIDDAMPMIRFALGLRVLIVGPHSQAVAEAAQIHAYGLSELGQHDAALHELQRALAIQRRTQQTDGTLAITLNNLGAEALLIGDFAMARRYHDEALERRRAAGNPTEIAVSLGNLADVDRAEGKLDDAAAAYEEALERWREGGGIDSWPASWSWNGLGLARLGAGDLDGAQRALQRALRIRETVEASPAALASTRFDLAKVALARDDLESGRTFAEAALHGFEAAGVPGEDQAAQVRAWLAEHVTGPRTGP